jgi:hypothetical protein
MHGDMRLAGSSRQWENNSFAGKNPDFRKEVTIG